MAATSDVVTGLVNGTTYEFQVKASNPVGDLAWAPVTPVTAIPMGWAQISAGHNSTCAVTMAGKAYCWGDDISAQLGNGTTTDQTSPSPVG